MADFKQGSHKGTIKSTTAIGKPYGEGEQKTWFFGIQIEEDGKLIEGSVGWKQDTPKFKAGDVIMFDKELDARERIKIKNTKLADDSKGPSGPGSTYNNPILIKRSAMGQAQRLARLSFDKLNENITDMTLMTFPKSIKNIDAAAKIYYDFIMKVGDSITRDNIQARAYSLENAISIKNYIGMTIDDAGNTIKSGTDILKVAEHFYEIQQNIQ